MKEEAPERKHLCLFSEILKLSAIILNFNCGRWIDLCTLLSGSTKNYLTKKELWFKLRAREKLKRKGITAVLLSFSRDG